MSTETNVSMTEAQDMYPLMYEYKPENDSFILTYENGVVIETNTPDLSPEVIQMYKAKVRGN